MMGIEEEFFIVDEENLFPVSSTPDLILRLINKNARYLKKSSMESPISRELFKIGFPVIELKTSPQNDIDCLLEELTHHRKMLADVADQEHLLVVPCGLYPTHSPGVDSCLLCCAIHVHISGYPLGKAFYALVGRVPELIALTANSPFLNGKECGKAMRILYSYAIGVPTGFYNRMSDVIVNRKLQTVELRACDTQIVSGNVRNLVQLVWSIVDSDCKESKFAGKIDRVGLVEKRLRAAKGGRFALEDELNELYEEVFPSLNEFGLTKSVHNYLKNDMSPADFQIDIAKRHGLANVIESLWVSFRAGRLRFSNTKKEIRRNRAMKLGNLPSLLLYFPIHVSKVFNKFVQDDMVRTVLLAKDAKTQPDAVEQELWKTESGGVCESECPSA